jgi:EAL domain-containing protein (putative c-di-GMP-specific phosphodiesterase class I)
VETAHALGSIVVAKSVETLAQLRALEKAGCDALQGWLLGRPGKVPNLTE